MATGQYTVSWRCDCRVIHGSVPILEMCALLRTWSDEELERNDSEEAWFIDAPLSVRLGATMVCGTRRNLKALRDKLEEEYANPTTGGAV